MSIAAETVNTVRVSSGVIDTIEDMEDDDAPLTDVVNTKEKIDDKENFESTEMWTVKQEQSEDNHVIRNPSASISNLSGTVPVVQNFPVNSLKRKFPDDESVVFLDDMILQPLQDRVLFPLNQSVNTIKNLIMRQTVEHSIIQLKEIQNHLGSLRNILSSESNVPNEKYFKDSVEGNLSDISIHNYESRIMEEEKNKVIDRDDKLIHTIAEGFNGLVQWSPQWNASLYKCQALIRAKNEEIFSLREKNRKKDIQIVLLKDEKLKKSRAPYSDQTRPSTSPPIRRASAKLNGQMRAVLPVNGGQVVNKVHQVNGGHLINNGGQIVRKVQNVTNLNQIKIPAGSKLIQVGNQKLPVTNTAQFTQGFNQPIRMVTKNANGQIVSQSGQSGQPILINKQPNMSIITGSTMAKNISTNQQPRFAKVEVVDQFGNRKIANIPVSELNRMKRPQVQMTQNVQAMVPKKEKLETENFFVGGEQEETQKDIKVEMVDEEGNDDTQIEEIENSAAHSPTECIDEQITEVNLMEGDAVEIKNEPKSNYDSSDLKISDGIDHSALEGLVNMCDSTKPASSSSSPKTSDIAAKPTAEESEEIAAKWTDDQIQKEIDKVGKMGETDEPKCAICKRTFTSVAYLKSHMRAHKEPLRCRVCYMEFRMASKLKNHEKIHLYETPHTCSMPNCGLIFKTEVECKQHEESHNQRFKCEICGKQLASEKSKNEHKVTFHLGGSEFQCDHCGKAFSNKSTLNRHKLLHQNEKPYPCNLCKRAFIDQKTLKNHQKTCSKHFFSVLEKPLA